MLGVAYDPPDVTWPLPELAEGAPVLLRLPPEEPELLPPEVLLPELLLPELLLPELLLPELLLPALVLAELPLDLPVLELLDAELDPLL